MNDTCQKIADEMRTRYGACPATIAAHAVDVANMLPRWAERLTALSAGASGGGESWTDEQCLEFASIAFRHAPKNLPAGVTLNDIRIAARRVSATPATGGPRE